MKEHKETPKAEVQLKWVEEPLGDSGGAAGSKGALVPDREAQSVHSGTSSGAGPEPLRWVEESFGEGGAAGSKGAMLPAAADRETRGDV